MSERAIVSIEEDRRPSDGRTDEYVDQGYAYIVKTSDNHHWFVSESTVGGVHEVMGFRWDHRKQDYDFGNEVGGRGFSFMDCLMAIME